MFWNQKRFRITRLQKHYIIYRHINDFPVSMNLSVIGEKDCLFYVIILILDELVQCSVSPKVLTRLHLNRHCTECIVIIYQEIDFAFRFIVIVPQCITVSTQFLGNHGFVNSTQIDAAIGCNDCIDIVSVQQIGKNPYIIQIQLYQFCLAPSRSRILLEPERKYSCIVF